MKKIKPLEEGKTKSQIKTYEGDLPLTQAPPPPKPPKRCGGYPRDWVKLKPTEKQLERERKQKQLEESRMGDKLPDFEHIPPAPDLKKVMEKLKEKDDLFPGATQRAKDIIANSKFNNMEKRLGKIKNVYFGIGGYQDCQIGIHFTLGGDSWGVTDSNSVWDPQRIKCTENTQWTEEDRTKSINDIVRYVSSLLKDAKVETVNELEGKPIECSFDGNMLKEWRILTEVL